MKNKDKFGFYQVGELKIYSKFDAAEISVKLNQPLTWHFNDDIFKLYNWAIEPAESLNELYRIRAQQLRDNYDYLVLWYSGGADSDNILNTFVDNNIPLDEAAGFINLEGDKNKDGFLNGEIFNLTVPKIQHIRDTSQPWLKHNLIDICQITIDYFNNVANKFDWVHKIGHYSNPNYIARTQMVKTQRHWMDMINQGKRVAFIYGVDKPKIVNIGNKFALIFRDVVDVAATTHQQVDEVPGQFNELFYWTPDLPELIIKQAHVLKKYMKTLLPTSPFLSTVKSDRDPVITINGVLYWLTSDGIHTALYPNWRPQPFQIKPNSLIFTPRDHWFFNLSDSEVAKQTWRQGLEHIWQKTPDKLKVDKDSLWHGFKTLSSCPYDIGT